MKNDSANALTVANNLLQSKNVDTGVGKNQVRILFKPQKHFSFEAGIQLKQQIPLSGQKVTAYNYNGNKNLFGDYIPSLFIKFEKDKRWFLQGEFSYAVPYFVKQFSYSRQTKADYAMGTITVTTAALKKTYYDELPLSFNYYMKSHWYIGAGVLYGWFHGAVAE